MSHPFGDLIRQHLSRKHGFSQNKLAEIADLDPAIISAMCHGERFTGPYARERVIKIIWGLSQAAVLRSLEEANALLTAAGMAGLSEGQPKEEDLLLRLRPQPESNLSHLLKNLPDPVPGEPPFKGLRYFDEDDAAIFFGREQLTAKLIGRLRENRFLAVVGASGSGKSSVIRAGLIPALRRNEPLADSTLPPEGSSNWAIHVIIPTAHPLEALAASLTHDVQSVAATSTLIDELSHDPRCLHLYARKILSHISSQANPQRPSGCLLLVVDQFEEVFTLCRSETERQSFINNLLTAVETDGPTIVLITLRADFYAQCGPFAGLRELLAQRQEYIGPMNLEERRRVIEEPTKQGRWDFEIGLVDLILKDAGEEPGALPLLSHVLLETWKQRQGATLTLKGYQEAGGVQGAIAKTAEMVFTQRLSSEQQIIARKIFLRLTELGEGTPDTRRRATRDQLIPRPEDAPAVETVLRTLVEARLISINKEMIEVAHEALIREWPTLRMWLKENREGLQTQHHLTEAAQEWARLERDPGTLYRGARLAVASEWAEANSDELNSLELEFIEASRSLQARELEAAKKRATQLRRLALSLSGVLTLAIIATITALFFSGQANRNMNMARTAEAQAMAQEATANIASTRALEERDEAQRQACLGQSRELAGAAVDELEVDPELSILLALQAISVTEYVGETVLSEVEDALHRALQASRIQLTLPSNQGSMESVAFSPDGMHLATSGDDKTAKVWDLASGKVLLTLFGHTDKVYDVTYSPDGGRLATASVDQTARVWEATFGQELFILSGHTDQVFRVVFSPDGKRLATASADRTAKVWEAVSGKELLTLSGHTGQVYDVAFSPDGKHLVTASADQTAKIWDATSGQELFTLSGHTGEVTSVAFSPDGTRLATASEDDTTKVWDAASGKELFTLSGHAGSVWRVAFSPDGTRLATASMDSTAKVWDATSGKELFTLSGHAGIVWSVAFSPDGTHLATVSIDDTAKIWSTAPSRELLILSGHTDKIYHARFSPDGTRLATASADETAKVWGATSGQELLTLSGHTGIVYDIAFDLENARLATASADQTAKVWGATSGQELLTLSGHTGQVYDVAFSPDGKHLATASADQTAKIWDATSGQELFTLSGHTGEVTSVAFSPDGTHLATASEDDTAKVWDAASGKELFTLFNHTDDLNVVAFSPDGAYLATGGLDGIVRIWDATSGDELFDLFDLTASIKDITFSPDGKRLAAADTDKTVKVWDAASGKILLTLFGHSAEVNSVAFSPDGDRLVSGSSDKMAQVYALRVEDLVALAQTRVTRSLISAERKRYLYLESCLPTS